LVVYNGYKKTFDSNTINNCFIQRVLGPHVLRQNQLKSLIFLDSAPCHRTASVKSKFEEFKINLQLLPPRMTSLVQPADVSWFKSIKASYSRSWTSWFTSNDIAFTKEGNLKSPGYANVSF
jgi:hypothetical protein